MIGATLEVAANRGICGCPSSTDCVVLIAVYIASKRADKIELARHELAANGDQVTRRADMLRPWTPPVHGCSWVLG